MTTKTEEPTVIEEPTSETQTEVDQELNEQEILAGVPALLPANQFRQRQRSAVMSMAIKLGDLTNDEGEFEEDNSDAAVAFYALLADADDFFESIAADKKGYVQWSQDLKNSEQVFGTLITRYVRAVGE